MKTNKLIPLLFTTLLLSTGVAHAQITVGPRVGLNLASAHFSYDLDTKFKVGGQGGVTLNAQFGKLALQPSLLFSQKGYKIDDSAPARPTNSTGTIQTKADVRLNYLEIPVNLVYCRDGDQGFQLFAGPYIGIGLSGKHRGKTEVTEDIPGGVTNTYTNDYNYKVQFDKQTEDEDKIYFRRLNVGLSGGIGYKTGSAQIQLSYMYGLSNMFPGSSNNSTLKERSVQLSLAYFFKRNN